MVGSPEPALFPKDFSTFLGIQYKDWQFLILLGADKVEYVTVLSPGGLDMLGFALVGVWHGQHPTENSHLDRDKEEYSQTLK